MHVFIYTMTILMLLATMTYVQLEKTRSFASTFVAYTHYMKAVEVQNAKQYAESWYAKIPIKTGKSTEKQKAEGIARLSLFQFINKERNRESETYVQTKQLFKQLLITLFEDQQFFKNMLTKWPQFMDELITQIENSVDNLPEDEKMERLEQLSKLIIEPQELHHVLYLMLTGKPDLSPKDEAVVAAEIVKQESDASENKNEEDASDLGLDETAHSQSGYISLMDVVSLKNASKIRIFLASRHLLTAIFKDSDVVERVCQRRYELFKQVSDEALTKDQAAEMLKNEFELAGSAGEYSAILSFSVSKINPHQYE